MDEKERILLIQIPDQKTVLENKLRDHEDFEKVFKNLMTLLKNEGLPVKITPDFLLRIFRKFERLESTGENIQNTKGAIARINELVVRKNYESNKLAIDMSHALKVFRLEISNEVEQLFEYAFSLLNQSVVISFFSIIQGELKFNARDELIHQHSIVLKGETIDKFKKLKALENEINKVFHEVFDIGGLEAIDDVFYQSGNHLYGSKMSDVQLNLRIIDKL